MSRRVGIAISGVTIAALVCAVVAGCGGKEESAAVEPVTRPATDDTAGQPGVAATQAPRMANAVATGAGAAVDLQYELAPRPEVGQPFEIELSLIPGVPADTLDVQLNATSGLRVTSTETIRFEGVQAGERYASKAMVIGDAPGLYYVGLVVRMATQVQADTRTFSIPVVIGTAPPAPAAQAAPTTDAQGQPIEPAPALGSAETGT
jgi:hypothetical protein